jgi:SAM-dependent MidA family methyltransferase
MSRLNEVVLALVAREGPIRFDRFQELALYAPELGYYERAGRVGREGDFVTGASWHPAFGRALARIARRLAPELGTVDVLDVGAGEGELLSAMRDALAGDGSYRFRGVERSRIRRELAVARDLRMSSDLDSVGPHRGLVVAYELFDALPVRALRVGDDGRLLERAVGERDGALVFVEVSCSDEGEIRTALAARGASLEPGQLLEIRPGARSLAHSLAEKLEAGLLLVFDYGASARALYGPARPNGTLEAFTRQRVTRDVLSEPGERDITAWVDFTELEEAFTKAGLSVHGLVSQSRLLLAAGVAEELADDPERPPDAARSAERNAIAKLFAPGGMGESIRVLVAERGTAVGASLVTFPTGK